MDMVLGIDVGTTNIKACLFAVTGGLVSMSSTRTPVTIDGTFGECHVAQDLWHAVSLVVKDCLQDAEERLHQTVHVHALSVASFAEEGVFLDLQGQPVSPVIPWYDERTKYQVHEIARVIDPAHLRCLTGMPLDRSFSLCKILWMKENHPSAFSKSAMFVPVSDYINFQLTGQLAVSPSLASRTLLYSPFRNCWLDEVASLFDLPLMMFPSILAGGEVLGSVTPEVAQATGLSEDAVVIMGGHDDACAALGAGVLRPGTGILSSGTAEAIYVIAPGNEVETQSPSLCIGRDATGSTLYLSDFVATGALIRWTMEHMRVTDSLSQQDIYQAIALAAKNALRKPATERFSFTRDPISLSSFSWSYIHEKSSAIDLLTAVIEATATATKKILWEIGRIVGQRPTSLVACGGLCSIPEYAALKSERLSCDLYVHPYTELTAGGAAVLAAKGSQVFSTWDDAVSTLLTHGEGNQ